MTNATNFDGRLHRSTALATNERVYISNGIATPDGLQGLLVEAYVYARECAQLMFCRSFLPEFAVAALTNICNVHAPVPAQATALLVVFRYDTDGDDKTRGVHKVTLQGAITDLVSANVLGEPPLALDPSSFVPRTLAAVVRVPLDDAVLAAKGIDRDDLQIVVEVVAEQDGTGDDFNYFPLSVTGYWLSEY